MKRYLLLIGAILLGLSVRAQSVTYTCRYWFDRDLEQAVTTTFSESNWQEELDVGPLADGLHTLHLHVMDTSMRWSAPQSFLFLKVTDTPSAEVTYYHWFDRDFEHKQSGSIGNGQLLLDVDDLELGMHTLHVMTVGTEYNAVQSYLFVKTDAMGPDGGGYTYHCWFDRDLDNQQSDTLGNGSILLDVNGLSEGMHTVNVMLEGSNVSSTHSYLFLKVPPVESVSQLAYHYWFDRDFENRVTDSLGDGNLLLDVDGLNDGLHTLHVILEGTDMAATESYMFLKIAVQEPEQELQYNCWFDQDYSTLVTGSVGNGVFLVPVGMLPVGDHDLFMQVNDGTLSSPAVYSFYRDPMITVISNPVNGGTATGQLVDTICTLTAQPAQGFAFVSWMTALGEVLSTSPVYSLVLTEDASIVANFVRVSYNITATANPSEGGTVSGAGLYNYGQTATLTATANEGYNFISWTLGNEVVSDDATYSFTVTEDAAYVANFEPVVNSYTIMATANPEEGGTVEGAGTYAEGETCTLTATANEGYSFISWTLGNEVVSDNATYSFTVTEDAAYVANFEPVVNSYTITATTNPEEGGTVEGAGTYAEGETCTLTATANEGYSFINWTQDGEVVSNSQTYSFVVTEAAEFVANFDLAANSHTITATANPTEGGTVSGDGTYAEGDTCTLTATANEGYSFINWTLGNEVVSDNATYSFVVTEDAAFVANFEPIISRYTITATSNPEEGGTVEGAGTYTDGSTCTLTATANEGYAFVNWMKGNEVVSSDETYSFVVSENAAFVANFAPGGNHWTYDPYEYTNNMTITGIIQIDGEEQYNAALEVGAFCNGECRGTARPTLSADFDRYFLFFTIYGDDEDVIVFRLYDHSIGAEINKACASSVLFESNSVVGTIVEPFVFNFASTFVQTTSFVQGWTWWSTYIEQEGVDGLQMLEEGLDNHGHTIKSQTDGFDSYVESYGWYGSLDGINNESSYQVKVNESCEVEMTGVVANPADHPITLHHGWTWIGYPVSTSMDLEEALAGLSPVSGDMLKSQNNGFASYLDGMGWYGSLSTLHPGMGLMYKSNSSGDVTLTYSTGARNSALKPNQTTENNHWIPALNAYPDNMSMIAIVELDDEELRSESYELAAFANGECRGSARLMYIAPLNRYMAFLTVAGNEVAELHFGLFDTETSAVEMQCFASLGYETNAVIGNFDEPYVVRFRSMTGVSEWASSLQVYPNPVECGQMISLRTTGEEMGTAQVEIINALGVVETRFIASQNTAFKAPNIPGIYMLRISVEGEGMCYRKLVVR